MIAHIVLLEPRADLEIEQRRTALEALTRTVEAAPGVSRFRIGRRIRHGLDGYERAMRQDFAFVLVIEFEDRAALLGYLESPAHAGLGRLFTTATVAALAYDYELHDGRNIAELGRDWLSSPPTTTSRSS